MCTQLPFFKSYMAMRMFRKWRAAARTQRFEKVRNVHLYVMLHML